MRGLLLGSRVRLTALQDSDQGAVESWFNDARFLRYYDMLPAIPQSGKQVETLFKEFEDSSDKLMLAIRTNDNDQIIGVTGFYDMLWTNGVATTFIGIGAQDAAGKGYGKETMELLLDFGFNELNLHRIELTTIAYNHPAIRLYEGLGFSREGAHREFILRDGQRHDLYLYGLLAAEWRSKHTLQQK